MPDLFCASMRRREFDYRHSGVADMKWLRTLIVFDKGNIAASREWESIHTAYVRSIQRIDNPRGSGKLSLRKKEQDPASKQWNRNGVSYLKNRFLEHMTQDEGWDKEGEVD